MKISVIIPVFEDWKRLAHCLDALKQQTINSAEFEVIVVDNSEFPGAYGEIEFAANTTIIHEPIPGSYAARNKGAEYSSGQLLAFTDSDCIPHKEWLYNAVKRFETDNCDLIGGKIDIFQPRNGSDHIYIYDKINAFPQEAHVPDGKCVTANMIVKQSVFRELGGFDHTLKSGGDWDFSKRVMRNCYSMVYDDTVTVSHPANKALPDILKKQFRLVCWGGIIAKRKYGYTNLRLTMSEIYNSLTRIRGIELGNFTLSERWILFYVNTLKKTFRILVRIGITLKIIDPEKVRK